MPDARAERIARAKEALAQFIFSSETGAAHHRLLTAADYEMLQELVNVAETPVILTRYNLSTATDTTVTLLPGQPAPLPPHQAQTSPAPPSRPSRPHRTRTRR